MEFTKQIFGEGGQLVDVYHKKKFEVKSYLKFLIRLGKDRSERHIAEVPLFPAPIVIDFDIKVKGEKICNLYDNQDIARVYQVYYNNLARLSDIKEAPIAFLLEKKPRIENDEIKHGFHMHFPFVSMEKFDAKKLFQEVKNDLGDEHGSRLDDVVGKTWLLYGSSKAPGMEPFTVTQAVYNNREGEIVFERNWKTLLIGKKISDIKIDEENVDSMLPAIFSMRNNSVFSDQKVFTININESDPHNIHLTKVAPRVRVNLDDEKIRLLVEKLDPRRSVEYRDWVTVCMVLASVAKTREDPSDLREIFHNFSKNSSGYDETACDVKFDSFLKSHYEGGVGIGTLIHMAKEDGGFQDVSEIFHDYSQRYIPVHDYDIAKMVKNSITLTYMTHKDLGCFEFRNTVWVDVSGWENIFKNHIDAWAIPFIRKTRETIERDFEDDEDEKKAYLKPLNFLIKKLNNFPSKSSVVKALFDLYFDVEALKLLTPNRRYLAFNNCVLDIDAWKLVPGEPKHFLIQKVNHDLVMWDEVPEENKQFVLSFFEKIFPDEALRNYCLKNMSRMTTGRNVHKQFQVWTGIGNNGKSAMIRMLENVFGRMTMKIPKSAVMGQNSRQGGACPEIFRLKDALFAIIDEVTDNDYLDPGQIKGLSGNDKLYGRDLYQASKDINEIEPAFYPVLITNHNPIIKKPDDATWARIRLIEFESIFKENVQEEIERNPGVDRTRLFSTDPGLNEKLKNNGKYFLSLFVSRLFEAPTFDSFFFREEKPQKVLDGLIKFKAGQNIMKKFLDENFTVVSQDDDPILANRLAREYNASRPKIILSLDEVKIAIESYQYLNPSVRLIGGDLVRGLKRISE